MGTALAIVALILSAILFPLGLLLTFFVNLHKRRWSFSFKRLDQQFLSIATSIDASGNVVCKDLFNLILKQKGGVEFGNRKETISSALGKNELLGALTKTGKILVFILSKKHCINAINENLKQKAGVST